MYTNDLNLPAEVSEAIEGFVDAAKNALGDALVSLILFGSAAEGRLRATSDVNLIALLSRFDIPRVDRLRDSLCVAHATIRLDVMFLLEAELPTAVEAFAVKFADIHERHRVLYGADPFSGAMPSRNAMVRRLRQILLNSTLRLRERYALLSLREEQLTAVIAETAAPLRSAAASILALENRPVDSPKAALTILAQECGTEGWQMALENLSRAREEVALPPGIGIPTLIALIRIVDCLRERSELLQ